MSHQDIIEIINTVNLYPLAVDTLQFELFDDVFTEDAHVDFGGPAQWHDRVSLKRDMEAVHVPFQATQHSTSNHRVTVTDDQAHCISYVHAHFIRDIPGGNMFEACGWYDDTLQRTSEGWRIRHRVNRTCWSGGNPLVMQTMPGVTVELQHHSLSMEAKAGRVAYFKSLSNPGNK